MSILIFTDGSSRGNPGPGGWGAIIHNSGNVLGDKVTEIGGREDSTTNNRMELTAVIKALEWVAQNSVAGTTEKSIKIKSDSKYVIHGATLWVSGWKRNGWKTAGKKDVSNRDLWEKLSDTVDRLSSQGFVVAWEHVDGHVGVAGNERCDEIATSFADGNKPDLYSGSFEAYSIDLHAKIDNSDAIKEKRAKSRSSIKAYSYLSLVNGVLNKHKTWAECEANVKGVKGAKFKKSTSPENEAEIIKSWGLYSL